MQRTGEQAAEHRQQASRKLRIDQQWRNSQEPRVGDGGSQNGKQPNQQPVEPEGLFGEASGDEAAKAGSKEQRGNKEQMQRFSRIGLAIKGDSARPEHNELNQQFKSKIDEPAKRNGQPVHCRQIKAAQNDIPQAIRKIISETSIARTQSG